MPMQQNFNHSDLRYVIGNAQTLEKMRILPALRPFEDQVIEFLNDLSKVLLRDGKEYSDVVTFGFWARKAALKAEKAKYNDLSERLGRGIVLHSTPSNVPVNFAFSFSAGLLAGNANVVRLPGKRFEQVDIICSSIKSLITEKHCDLAPYVCFLKFPPNQAITDTLSAICDTRVIWGGDVTIQEIRRSPLKPRANEITFSDRHSIAVIEANAYLRADNKAKIASDFYNDTYFSDQNACTAPRIVFWIGEQTEAAKEAFWTHLHKLIQKKYLMAPVQAIRKRTALLRVSTKMAVVLENSDDELITRVKVDTIDSSLMEYKYNSGFFFEFDIKSLFEILPVCDDKCQTLVYYGVSPDLLRDFVTQQRPRGIDRMVPMGNSMDFTLVWDGYDLIRGMSRVVSVCEV